MSEPLLETWNIHARINHYFLAEVDPDALWRKPEKGKSVGAHFAHIHSVRMMWLKSAAPALLDGLAKVEDGSPKEAILAALAQSDDATSQMLAVGFETGRIKGFKPHPTAFAGYLIAHEAHHRGQAELTLRQLGAPLSDKVAFGLWEWGVR